MDIVGYCRLWNASGESKHFLKNTLDFYVSTTRYSLTEGRSNGPYKIHCYQNLMQMQLGMQGLFYNTCKQTHCFLFLFKVFKLWEQIFFRKFIIILCIFEIFCSALKNVAFHFSKVHVNISNLVKWDYGGPCIL